MSEWAALVRRTFESAPEHTVVVACEPCKKVQAFDSPYEAFDFFLAHLHRRSVVS